MRRQREPKRGYRWLSIAELKKIRELLKDHSSYHVAAMFDRDPSHMRKIRRMEIHKVAA